MGFQMLISQAPTCILVPPSPSGYGCGHRHDQSGLNSIGGTPSLCGCTSVWEQASQDMPGSWGAEGSRARGAQGGVQSSRNGGGDEAEQMVQG